MTPEEVKAKLLVEAAAAIDQMLAKRSPANKITMREISQLAIESGQQVQAAVLHTLTEDSQDAEPAAAQMVCQRCGGKMSYKGKRTRQVVADGGETAVQRDYYYCGKCKVGVFPPR
jgi:DNA-directed RNA polymerase subunit RPC12/RpoP